MDGTSVGRSRHETKDRRLGNPTQKSETVGSPPLIDPSLPGKSYTYDIRPDCQHWLSLNFANREYKRVYREHVYENDGEVVCHTSLSNPRTRAFTIQQQISSLPAAALALHNRCILKYRYLQCIDAPWSELVASPIRHYGLTFSGSEYHFWCIKHIVSQQDIKADWTQQGSETSNVSLGKLLREVEVEDFTE